MAPKWAIPAPTITGNRAGLPSAALPSRGPVSPVLVTPTLCPHAAQRTVPFVGFGPPPPAPRVVIGEPLVGAFAALPTRRIPSKVAQARRPPLAKVRPRKGPGPAKEEGTDKATPPHAAISILLATQATGRAATRVIACHGALQRRAASPRVAGALSSLHRPVAHLAVEPCVVRPIGPVAQGTVGHRWAKVGLSINYNGKACIISELPIAYKTVRFYG